MTTSAETVTDRPEAEESPEQRMDQLSDRVGRLRANASAGRFDRWLLIAGAVLMPLGGVFILLGWAGASRTPLNFEQIDYLISGGIGGLAVVVAGGFCYFAYWQTVRLREARSQSAELTRSIGRLESLIGGTAPGVAPGEPIRLTAATPTYVATAHGTIFHRPDCAAVAGRDDVTEIDVTTTTLTPCRICTPLDPA